MGNRYLLWWTLLLFLFFSGHIVAQVGIGNTDPHESSLLDIRNADADKGVLLPRVNIPDLTNAAPIDNPEESLLVYNTNTTTGPGYVYWNGVGWQSFGSTSVKIEYQDPSFMNTPASLSGVGIKVALIYSYDIVLTKTTLVEIDMVFSVEITKQNGAPVSSGGAIQYGVLLKEGLFLMPPIEPIISNINNFSSSGAGADKYFTLGGSGYRQFDAGTHTINIYLAGNGGGLDGYTIVASSTQGGHFRVIYHN